MEREGEGRGAVVGGAWVAMHRRAFSFASEKRMNVAPARQTASTRRLHEYARPAVCAFYSRGTSEIIHAGRRRWRRVSARIGQEDASRTVVTSVLNFNGFFQLDAGGDSRDS